MSTELTLIKSDAAPNRGAVLVAEQLKEKCKKKNVGRSK